jgi:hypothetical protein
MIIVPDQKYNPALLEDSEITSFTKLSPGVSISKFLGSKGNPCSLSTIDKYQNDPAARKQLACNLYLHAELFRSINGNIDLFNDVRLIVAEGVYRGGPTETVGGENLLKQDGQMVTYKVLDENGELDYEKTFDVAEYWKDYMEYDELLLEYDNWDASGKLNAQVSVVMPKVDASSWKFGFKNGLETRYNGSLFGKNELIEVLEDV